MMYMFVWGLSAWNTDNADMENYVAYYTTNYNNLNIWDLADPGFKFINKLFNVYGFTFETYHIIIYSVLMTYICHQIWKRSQRPNLILFIYLFTAFIADVIQLRNSLALLFLLIGLFALIDNNERYPKFKFFVFNLLASSIHIAFVFYFVFLFINVKIRPRYFILGCILLSILGHSILGYFSTFTYIAENSFLNNRAESYLEHSSYWSVMICSFQYLIHYFVCKRCVMKSGYNGINVNCFMQINVLIAMLIIMSSVNMTFFRLFRNILLFSSIYLINGYLYKKNKVDAIYLSLYFLFMSFFHFWWGDVLVNVGIIFSNNLIW